MGLSAPLTSRVLQPVVINIPEAINSLKKFDPVLKRIVMQEIRSFVDIKASSPMEDMQEAFDYVIDMTFQRIAVRIRNNEYLRYPDITIRYPHEFNKIKSGLGQMYLYAWRGLGDCDLIRYVIFDLAKLRESKILDRPCAPIINNDSRRSSFITISISDLIKSGSLKVFKDL
jgi:hypothetical protein